MLLRYLCSFELAGESRPSTHQHLQVLTWHSTSSSLVGCDSFLICLFTFFSLLQPCFTECHDIHVLRLTFLKYIIYLTNPSRYLALSSYLCPIHTFWMIINGLNAREIDRHKVCNFSIVRQACGALHVGVSRSHRYSHVNGRVILKF